MAARELYFDLVNKIGEMDEVLNTEDDASANSRRKIVNDLIAATSDKVTPVLSSLIQNIENVPVEALPGVFLGLTRGLEKHFGKKVSELVDAQVPKPDPNAEKKPDLPDDEKEAILKARKDLLDKAKVIGDLAVQTAEMTEDEFEESLPKRRNVAGKRGPRAISFYTLSVGEKDFDKMADVAKEYGYEKSAELTKAIRDSGVNLTDPPKSFSFTLKDGSVLEAVDTRSDEERDETAEGEDESEDE